MAIKMAFPELEFDKDWLRGDSTISTNVLKFTTYYTQPKGASHVPLGHWQENINCREFFCRLAEQKGFDPFVADNWQQVKQRDVRLAGVLTVSVRDTQDLSHTYGFVGTRHASSLWRTVSIGDPGRLS
jgi:hypothetical protein